MIEVRKLRKFKLKGKVRQVRWERQVRQVRWERQVRQVRWERQVRWVRGLANLIPLGLAQSDHIKQLPLYILNCIKTKHNLKLG